MKRYEIVEPGNVVCTRIKCRWTKCGPLKIDGDTAIARTRLVIIPWTKRGQYVLVGEDGTSAQVRLGKRVRKVTTFPVSQRLKAAVRRYLEVMD